MKPCKSAPACRLCWCRLVQLFGDSDDIDLQPDVHFAGLKAVYGPQGSDLEDKALVQITLGAYRLQHSTAQGLPSTQM